MKKLFLIFITLNMFSCANIPVSTMLKFSGFDKTDFAALEASDIRSKVSVSEPFTINLDETKLSLSIEEEKGIRNFMFPLTLLNQNNIAATDGLFNSGPAKIEYTFKLSEDGVKNLKEVQSSMDQHREGGASLSVSTGFNEKPEEGQFVILSIDLMLDEKDGFFSLIDNAKIDFDQQN